MRNYIQNLFNDIQDIDSGPFMSDDVLEENKTYFGYQLQEDYQNSDMNKNYTMKVSIIGYISRIVNCEENTLEIIDNCKNIIIAKLKDSNFKTSYKDVSIDNGIQKMQITGYAIYNEINKKLI